MRMKVLVKFGIRLESTFLALNRWNRNALSAQKTAGKRLWAFGGLPVRGGTSDGKDR